MGFAHLLALPFFELFCLRLSDFLMFLEFLFAVFSEAIKASTIILLVRSSTSHGRQRALGGRVVIYWKLCRFVVNVLQIRCRLFADSLKVVSFL